MPGISSRRPWLLIETGIIKGRKVTSYKSIKTDVIDAVDNGVITSPNPGDLEAFSAKIIEEIVEGKHTQPARLKATGLSCYRKGDAPERRGPAWWAFF
jgi:hypothetical protein